MNKKALDKQLSKWINELPKNDRKELMAHLSGLKSVYPFNEYEYRLMFLLDREIITLKEYGNLRNNFVQGNLYLELYGLAARTFGDTWILNHLMNIDKRIQKASKNDDFFNKLDPKFSGQYDLYIPLKKDFIRIEAKASRATATKERRSVETKALYYNSPESFWMNFQQLKLGIADVFIFTGVWIDKIVHWVLTNEEVENHPERSSQHRGGIESQIGINERNIKKFDKFLVKQNKLADTVIAKFRNAKK